MHNGGFKPNVAFLFDQHNIFKNNLPQHFYDQLIFDRAKKELNGENTVFMGFFVFFWFYSLFLNFLKCYYICFFIQQVPFFFQECDTNVMCFFFFNFIYLFVYFWLCWVFVSVRGLSLVAASGGHFSLWCAGLSLSWPLLVAEHRLQMRRPSNCGSRA